MTAGVVVALAAGPVAAQDAEVGGLIYDSFCTACHGEDGKGGGQLAAILAIHPPDLTQLAAGNGGVFPVSRVVRQIDGRDPELAHGGIMPFFGDWFDFPDTPIASEDGQPILTAAPIADLVTWLGTLQE
jgi:mono/diheme cytochrome c family protein